MLEHCDMKLTNMVIEDRISSLPDHILDEICSFLPTKDVVATSVLSKRWRHVFTNVTHLDFDASPIHFCWRNPHLRDSRNSFPIFKMFVDKVLETCHSNNITAFRLHFCKDDFKWGKCTEDCFPIINELEHCHLIAWISFPLTRGVRELDIFARMTERMLLPSALFRCRTLEVLKLDVNVDLWGLFSVRLPNLKELHLKLLFFPSDGSVTRLVSRCRSLEHLALSAYSWETDYPVHIRSSSLHSLAIDITDNWFRKPRSKVILDVPNLKYLNYVDTWSLSYSIGNLNALVKAEIDVAAMDDFENVISLISSLSNVRRLYLMAMCVQALNDCEIQKCKLPVFHNLNHLQLGCLGYLEWNGVLMDLLACAPFLETLTFTEGIAYKADKLDEFYVKVAELECQSWSKTQTVPSCFRSHLKRITINKYQFTAWELEMVKYFLRNSLILEKLVVVCRTSVALADRILLESTLLKQLRGSMTCSITVT